MIITDNMLISDDYSTSNRPAPHPEMVSTKVSSGSATRCARLAITRLSPPQRIVAKARHRSSSTHRKVAAKRDCTCTPSNDLAYDHLATTGRAAGANGRRLDRLRQAVYSSSTASGTIDEKMMHLVHFLLSACLLARLGVRVCLFNYFGSCE